MTNFFSFFLDLLYPRRCPLCDEPLSKPEKLACDCCFHLLSPLTAPLCFKCGKPLCSDEEACCLRCLKENFAFDRAFSLWNYGNPVVRASLHAFKYRGRKEYAAFYAEKLTSHFSFLSDSKKVTVLIPVPIHKKRYNRRGYNQAEAIAAEIAKRTGLPLITDLLIREKNTLPQNKLTSKARKTNLQNAFCINKASPYFQTYIPSVFLIDDIFTTGSTASICAGLLKEAGVSQVFVLSLAVSSN